MNESIHETVLGLDRDVRGRSPLVHQITNYVVMNFTANVTLALGGQPVMAHAPEEVAEMASLASALVLNIGTLEHAWIESMIIAGRAANKRDTPVIVDPVGAGATKLRTEAVRRILDEVKVSVLRGNAGEVMAVAGESGRVRGVDSTAKMEDALEIAGALAADRGFVVAVTGPVDHVTDGNSAYAVKNGHPMLSRVTGTGCAATAAIGCFVGVVGRAGANEGAAPPTLPLVATPCLAAAAALAVFGQAGEVGAERSHGPGSFVPALLDALHLGPQASGAPPLRLSKTA